MDKIITNYPKSEITGKIIGAAQEVHSELGPHYLEVVYQRALAYELKQYFNDFSREVDVPIYYKDMKVDTRRADFLIEDVLVEIKAKATLESKDYKQLLSYLKSSGFKVGLLLNFGAKSLQVKRMVF